MTEMKTYRVYMNRVEPGAGPQANFNSQVQAKDPQTARIVAEGQFRGYRCISIQPM